MNEIVTTEILAEGNCFEQNETEIVIKVNNNNAILKKCKNIYSPGEEIVSPLYFNNITEYNLQKEYTSKIIKKLKLSKLKNTINPKLEKKSIVKITSDEEILTEGNCFKQETEICFKMKEVDSVLVKKQLNYKITNTEEYIHHRKNVYKTTIDKVEYQSDININDITLFFENNSRKENDSSNSKREDIIFFILSGKIPGEWLINCKKWYKIYTELNKIMNILTNYRKYKITKKGGRKSNHDFELEIESSNNIETINLEFKHNCNKICNLPQFANISCEFFVDKKYSEFFYDNYIEKIYDIYNEIERIDKMSYMKYVHGTNYGNNFFKQLYDYDNINDVKKREKQKLVKKSIQEYLNIVKLDIDAINKKLLEQNNKVFILWDKKREIFIKEQFNKKDITITRYSHIKNNNTIVLNTESDKTVNMLLRWKNRIGILNPAWQISLKLLK